MFDFQFKIQMNGRDYNAWQKEPVDAFYSLYTIYHHFDKIIAKQKRSDIFQMQNIIQLYKFTVQRNKMERSDSK